MMINSLNLRDSVCGRLLCAAAGYLSNAKQPKSTTPYSSITVVFHGNWCYNDARGGGGRKPLLHLTSHPRVPCLLFGLEEKKTPTLAGVGVFLIPSSDSPCASRGAC